MQTFGDQHDLGSPKGLKTQVEIPQWTASVAIH